MPKHIYITFSGSKYFQWTKNIVDNAPRFGAEEVYVYDDVWLRECCPEFCARHKDLFEKRCCKANVVRGVCWFLFKPLIFLHRLARMEPGQICIYSDGDTFPIADLSPIYNECDKAGLMCFSAVGWVQKYWNKRDLQLIMNQDTEWDLAQPAACARFFAFKKGAEIPFKPTRFYPDGGVLTPEHFIKEWFHYLSDIRGNTFDPSVMAPEHPEFRENRCDQSVEGNLAHRYGLKLYREACGFGDTPNPDGIPWPEDRQLYGQIFEQRGDHSFDPTGKREGSSFRNVHD